MIKEVVPTSEYIKAIAGKFDLDTVFLLDLPEKSIVSLSAIVNCKFLVFLNLSRNKISVVSGLENLIDLKYLDISYNKIKSIDNLASLGKLKCLKAQGNLIQQINDIPKFLKGLVSIEKLYFQEMSGKDNNPITKIKDYRQSFFQNSLTLKYLDGTTKDIDFISDMSGINELNVQTNFNTENINPDYKKLINTNSSKFMEDTKFYENVREYDKNYDKLKKEIENDTKALK